MKPSINSFVLLCFALILSGCMGARFLKPGEKVFRKQKIKGNKNVRTEELASLYQQKPNRRFLLIFSTYVSLYQMGLKKYDKEELQDRRSSVEQEFDTRIEANEDKPKKASRIRKKKTKKLAKLDKALNEGNLLMRWGEPLSVYNQLTSDQTSDQMRFYLNSKGYFKAQVRYKEEHSKKKIKLTYFISENEPHKIDTLFYNSQNQNIQELMISNQENAKILTEENYDQAKLETERDRVYSLLKNNGYYDFNRQYITLNVDTAWGQKRVAVEVYVAQPGPNEDHRVFTIDSVIFTVDANIVSTGSERSFTHYNGITYHYFKDRYKRKVLDQRVFIYPGDLYSRERTLQTQRQLANLDIFKFININYDTTGGKYIANIFTSPLKKFQTAAEVGFSYSQGLPGPFGSINFKNRNPLNGLEILDINLSGGRDGVPAATSETLGLFSTEINGRGILSIPRFIITPSKKLRSRMGELNPKTNFSAGGRWTKRPEYERWNANTSMGYSWQNSRNHLYNVKFADISYIKSKIDTTTTEGKLFQARLDSLAAQGNNLRNSFEPSVVTSINATAILDFGGYGNQEGSSSSVRLYGESGGLMFNFWQPNFIPDSIIYQYLKANLDFRSRKVFLNSNVIAIRVNLGIAVPYGSNGVLPYEKYLFAGGSNSIRAWRPRRLGPGSYQPIIGGEYDIRFEQQGEVILETSFELRRKILGFLDGALFVDAGNIWTIKDEAARPGSQFQVNRFYREIAVGTGAGLRLNFSFLVVRFDAGIKIYDPSRPGGDRFVWSPGYNNPPFDNQTANELIVYNIGVGYPF